ASGRRRTAPSGRPSRSSPTRFSSSAAAATKWAAATSSCRPRPRRRRAPTSARPPTTTSRSRKEHGTAARPTSTQAPRRADRRTEAEELLLLPREGGRGGLQEREPAQAVHLGEGQDPLPPHHGRLPPPPGADRAGRQARASNGAAPVRGRRPARAA